TGFIDVTSMPQKVRPRFERASPVKFRLRRTAALVAQIPFDRADQLGGALEIGIDVDRAAEELECELGIAEPKRDLSRARERAVVIGIALEHLVAILQRGLVLAQHEVDRRALVPALGEIRLARDDGAKGCQRVVEPGRLHLLDATRKELVDRAVSGPAP